MSPGQVGRLQALFNEHFGRTPAVIIRTPGRVNLLGAHLDYNEGWVMPATIDRAIWLAAAPRQDSIVTVHSLTFQEERSFTLLELAEGTNELAWTAYPAGVAWALQTSGHELLGMDCLLWSDLPLASGLSSSAALEMAFVLAWERLAGFQLSGRERAQIGQQTENQFLGVGSGIMDQFTCIYGRAGHLLFLDCRNLRYELLPLPASVIIIVADSGVKRRLAGVDYNSRPKECREAAAILKQYLPSIRTLRDVSRGQLARYGHHLPPVLRRRAEHVVGECRRVRAGATALRRNDLPAFGRLMRESQISSRDNYENSIPELDLLAETAWSQPGCYGARFAGGGFGGCLQIVAEETAVAAISRALQTAFSSEFGRPVSVFAARLARGATVMMDGLAQSDRRRER